MLGAEMREQTWNLRQATTHHFLSFQNLLDFHDLTSAWLKELNIERAPHLLSRGISHHYPESVAMLELLASRNLNALLDDTAPEDVLGRLENIVWIVQAWTLKSIVERSGVTPTLESVLEQTSWKEGRRIGEQRWANRAHRGEADLRQLRLALADSPFRGNTFNRPVDDLFIIKRALRHELSLELCVCPHRITVPEVQSVEDLLCRLHGQWMRGFLYALDNRILVKTEFAQPRCTQTWTLQPDAGFQVSS
ncbi:hypothetical protein WDW86_19920 [Bdellovibrionota bacterium FG-2]